MERNRNRVLISGLPRESEISRSDLIMYFQSKKKSGGGDVSSLEILEDGKALVIFENQIVAREVLNREHKINGIRIQATVPRSLKVVQSPVSTKEETSESSSSEESSDEENEDSEERCSIWVKDLPLGTTKSTIQTYFENPKKKHKGGPVRRVDYLPSSSHALVVFQHEEDAKRMVDFKKHKLQGVRLEVTCLPPGEKRSSEEEEKEEEEDEEEKEEAPDKISPSGDKSQENSEIPLMFEVSGIANLSTEDSLKLYLENTRRSGGGEVNMLTFNREKNLAEVKLESVKDLNRLLCSKHIIEGAEIHITPKEQEEQVPMDPLKIRVKGLNPSTSSDCVKFYMEKMSSVEVLNVQRGGCGNALVSFAESPDFEKLFSKIVEDKDGIEKHRITVDRAPFCNCLQVSGLSSKINKEQMNLYFESPSKGCGAVPSKIELQPEEGKALVYFDETSVIDKAMGKPTHGFGEEKWRVELFYPFLNEEIQTKTKLKASREVTEIEVDPEIMDHIATQHGVELQEVLDEFHLEVEWTPKKSAVKLKEKETANAKECGEWNARVESVKRFICQFQSKEYDVHPYIWGEVLEKANEIGSMDQFDKVAIEILDGSRKIRIIAKKEDFQKASVQVETMIDQVNKEKQLQESVETVVEEDIDTHKLSLLRISDVYERLQDNKHVKLNIDEHLGKLTITGPQESLTKINMEVLKFFQKIKEEPLELPEGILHVLQSTKGRDFIEKLFREQQIYAVLVHGQRRAKNEASIFYTNKGQGKEAVKLIESITRESSVHIEEKTVEVLNNPEWRRFSSRMEENYKVTISFQSSGQTLWIRGIEPDTSECHNQVEEYVQRNTIYTELVKLNEGRLRFLFEICIESIKEIKEELKDLFVEVDKKIGGLSISGTKEGIHRGKEKLMALIGEACEEKVKIEKPGMKRFFGQDGQGAKLIKVVETEHKCVVEIADDLPKHKIISDLTTSDFVGTESGKCVCSYVTKEGKKIAVYKDDLTKHKVDVIVNAANSELQHYAGLAGAIVKEGGEDIQNQCNRYIADNGTLFEGHVMESGPGKLPCKRIIHAVGPRWDNRARKDYMEGRKTKQEGLLRYAIENCLERAKNDQVIAIPAVSTGIFRFPVELCASVLTDTVIGFFQENPVCKLSEVHFTNHDDATVKCFSAEMEKRFEKGSTLFIEGSRKSLSMGLPYSNMEFYEKSKDYGKMPVSSLDDEEWVTKLSQTSHKDDAFLTAEGMKIYVTVENIAHEKADVLVNTAGENLKLQSNACARSFLDAAGPTLQMYCDAIAPVKPGDIGTTRPTGKLKCNHVFHAVCSMWAKGKGKPVLQSILRKCFGEANRLGARSIAIPAIGTGILNFPRDVVANLSFEEALQFSRENEGERSLKEVKFVVYGKDKPTVKAFKDEIERRRSLSRSPFEINPFQEPKITTRTTMATSTPRLKKRSESWYEINVQNLSVHVQSGDITQESTDAIVVVSNPELDIEYGGGAGAAIMKAGGDAVKIECQNHRKLLPGEVSMTSAGRLRVKNLIHYVPHDSMTDETLSKAIFDCLSAAENQGMSSISFPAIGTGKLRISPDRCAKAMLRGASWFSKQTTTTLKLIRIVVFQEAMIKDFVSVLKEFTGQTNEKEEGGWSLKAGFRKIGNYLGLTEEVKKEKEPLEESLQPSKISLQVYCRDPLHLIEAKKAINELVSRNCIKKDILHPIIAFIEKSQMREIHSVELRCDTKIIVEKKVRRIIFEGNSDDVIEAMDAIHAILNKVKDMQNERSKVETIMKNITWQYYSETREVFEPYSEESNVIIERAYESNEKTVDFRENGKMFTITFATNTVKGEKGEGRVIRKDIRMKDSVSTELLLPNYWAPQPKTANGVEETVHLVDLCPNKHSKEYLKVSDLFKNTCKNNIISISRVQNPTQFNNYAVRKRKMEKEKGKGKEVERLLFHGTGHEFCESINHTGFNRNFRGKNATKYGQGTYFAVNAEFSARSQYSPADSKGKRYMYLSRVLVGEYTDGEEKMLVPPPKAASKPTDRYDTVVDDQANPTIFVAFYDWQSYPEYLITFQ